MGMFEENNDQKRACERGGEAKGALRDKGVKERATDYYLFSPTLSPFWHKIKRLCVRLRQLDSWKETFSNWAT